MTYRVELFDTWNRRVAEFDDVPLLRATHAAADEASTVRGILPGPIADLSPGYRVRVYVDDDLFVEAIVNSVAPRWGDTRKLILEHYVSFHEVIEFEAEMPARTGNTTVSQAYVNRSVSQIVRDAINRASGPVHYTVDHSAYPDGAEREWEKLQARQTAENELEVGGIADGQWVSTPRIDVSGAYAKDGDTIAGLVVDGEAWPDLRLLLIDCEETALNAHAASLHGEVDEWTSDRYDRSGYKLAGDRAKAFLQSLIDTKGIDTIELNPHKNAAGEYDDRVDFYGRYLGLVYGGGECFNAAMVEEGHAIVYLYNDGKYHVPELELKDFFSYAGVHTHSLQDAPVSLMEYDVTAGVYEILTAMAYAAGGYIWSVDAQWAVRFRKAELPDRVLHFEPTRHDVRLGVTTDGLGNVIYFDGNPFTTAFAKTYTRGASIDEHEFHARGLDYFSIAREEDADALVEGLLDDVAYPTVEGEVTLLHGDATMRVGDIVEFRDGPLRRLSRRVDGEWGDRFEDRLVGRVRSVRHEFQGRRLSTTVELTSPLRSVTNPLGFIVRSQPGASTLFQFRLDEATVGVDLGYHLD